MSRKSPTLRGRATPQLMYRGKTISTSQVQRGGVAKGLGVAPREDYLASNLHQANRPVDESARTMGKFVVMKKDPKNLTYQKKRLTKYVGIFFVVLVTWPVDMSPSQS